jgi:AbrB family transcriptional regulator (stage V sporulation protein T)
MKATGIVRRIDDLGRVVIPKEIRRTMRIREGDPLEIYTSNDGEVIFKKYSAIGEMYENALQVAEILYRFAGNPTIVFDRDHVVSVAGVPKKEYLERRVSHALEEVMESRKPFFSDGNKYIVGVEGIERPMVACVPIVSDGAVTGALGMLEVKKGVEVTELQKSLILAGSQFLGRQLE